LLQKVKQLKEVGINDSEKVDDVVDRLITAGIEPTESDKITEKIKEIVPAIDIEGYWEAKKKLAEQQNKTNDEVSANINAGSPSGSEPDTGEDYTAEELKYAKEQGISPADARRILTKFKSAKRRLE